MFRKKRIFFLLLLLFLITGGFLFVQTVFAQEITEGLNVVNAEIELAAGDPRVIAARIVRAALGFLGIIALGVVLYGGFVWMTSGGNEEKITRAKKILTNGLIGLIIIVLAFSIVQYIINTFLGVRRPDAAPPAGAPVIGRYSGALGNGIIDSHYPPRGGTGIPRNTKIIVTFKEQMSLESIINNYNDNDTPTNLADDVVIKNNNGTPTVPGDDWMEVKAENIKIYKSLDGETAALAANRVKVTFTPDLKTFVFDPVDLLGSPSENIWHTAAIKPEVKKADGRDAFAGAFRDGYAWDFEVSTVVDTTPPQVESVWPWPDGRTNVPRNTLIQINFDEAMDPTTVSGKTSDTPPFDKIEVKVGTTVVTGAWEISNQYKTVEFISDDPCGTNSCGGTVYCLPASATINVLIKAATLSIDMPQDPEPPEAEWPYDGVTDVVGNSLDGNKNGTAQGSERDDERVLLGGSTEPIAGQVGHDHFGFSFTTSNEIDLTPPQIEAGGITPTGGDVMTSAPIEIIFTKLMSMGSFNTSNIILDDNQRDECAVWFTLGGVNLKDDGTEVRLIDDVAVKTKAKIYHGDFIDSLDTTLVPPPPTPSCSDALPIDPTTVMYYPRSTHNVKDIFQNCFFRPVGPTGPGGGTTCVAGERGCPSPLPWE
jgi:hypothetical protein